MAAKLMALGRPDRCVECGVDLSAGTDAYWDRQRRVVVCVACMDRVAGASVSAGEVEVDAGSSGAVGGVAGGSAQREYDRRSERESTRKQKRVADDEAWRTSIKAERPVLGRLVAAVTPKPQLTPESQSTTAWKTGAEGERRVAEVLAGTADIVVLHDRLVPGKGGANIDHIVVGPAGVFVVDAKKYSGRIEARDVAGIFRTDLRLYVAGRDRTKTVDGVLGQVEVVRSALDERFADVPVRGVLCFIGCEWGLRARPKVVRGVTTLWPLALSEHVAASGPHADHASVIAAQLADKLRPARA